MLFPAEELRILAYNREIHGLGTLAQRPITGMSSLRQILRAKASDNSECRGTVTTSPFSGLIHSE